MLLLIAGIESNPGPIPKAKIEQIRLESKETRVEGIQALIQLQI